jgi:hypothetical protein
MRGSEPDPRSKNLPWLHADSKKTMNKNMGKEKEKETHRSIPTVGSHNSTNG